MISKAVCSGSKYGCSKCLHLFDGVDVVETRGVSGGPHTVEVLRH